MLAFLGEECVVAACLAEPLPSPAMALRRYFTWLEALSYCTYSYLVSLRAARGDGNRQKTGTAVAVPWQSVEDRHARICACFAHHPVHRRAVLFAPTCNVPFDFLACFRPAHCTTP